MNKILTINSTIIENPANKQKRWRIKKESSLTKNSKTPKQNRVIECLHNSLQIAAAGQQCQTRKPLSKRPRKRSGMPRNFVFVDLSPVKNLDDSSDEDEKTSLVSPTTTPDTTVLDNQKLNTASNYELSASNDSFQSLQSDEESIFSSLEDSSIMSKSSTFGNESYMQEYNQINTHHTENNNTMLGLGLLNMDMSSNAGHWMSENADIYQEDMNLEPSVAYHSHINPFPENTQSSIEPQYDNLKRSNTVPKLPTQSKKTIHKRAKSTSEASKKKTSSSLQFRAYKAPLAKEKKEELSHRRTISEPVLATPKETDLLDFIDFNNQMHMALNGDEFSNKANLVMSESSSFTPNTEYSDADDYTNDLLTSTNMDAFLIGGCGSNEIMGHNQFDFDFNSYVSY